MKNKERGYDKERDFNIPSRENVRKGDIFYVLMFETNLTNFPITNITEEYVSHRKEGFFAKAYYNQAIILQTNTGNGTRLLVGKNADKSLLEKVLHSLDTNIQ